MELERVIDGVQGKLGRGGVVEGKDVGCRFAGPWRWYKRQLG